MCDFVPVFKDAEEAKQFWRGYSLAAWALAGLLAVELIMSLWLSGGDGASSLGSQTDQRRAGTHYIAKNQSPK